MKSFRPLVRILKMVVGVSLSIASCLLVSAQEIPTKIRSASFRPTGQRMQGSWRAVQIPEGPVPERRLLFTFTRDGSVLAAAPGNRESAGFGEWIRTGDREFSYTYERLRYDEQGHFVGTAKIRGSLRLSENTDGFSGPFFNEAFDADGNLVASLRGTIQASRIRVEPLN